MIIKQSTIDEVTRIRAYFADTKKVQPYATHPELLAETANYFRVSTEKVRQIVGRFGYYGTIGSSRAHRRRTTGPRSSSRIHAG